MEEQLQVIEKYLQEINIHLEARQNVDCSPRMQAAYNEIKGVDCDLVGILPFAAQVSYHERKANTGKSNQLYFIDYKNR